MMAVGPLLTPPAGLRQIGPHAVVVREHRGGGPDLGPHVADGGHPWTKQVGTKETQRFIAL